MPGLSFSFALVGNKFKIKLEPSKIQHQEDGLKLIITLAWTLDGFQLRLWDSDLNWTRTEWNQLKVQTSKLNQAGVVGKDEEIEI